MVACQWNYCSEKRKLSVIRDPYYPTDLHWGGDTFSPAAR